MFNAPVVKLLAWQHAIGVDGLYASLSLYRNAEHRFEIVATFPEEPENDYREELSSDDASEFLTDPDTVFAFVGLAAWEPTGRAC